MEALAWQTSFEAYHHQLNTSFCEMNEDLRDESELIYFKFTLYLDSVSWRFCELNFLKLGVAEFHDQFCLWGPHVHPAKPHQLFEIIFICLINFHQGQNSLQFRQINHLHLFWQYLCHWKYDRFLDLHQL